MVRHEADCRIALPHSNVPIPRDMVSIVWPTGPWAERRTIDTTVASEAVALAVDIRYRPSKQLRPVHRERSNGRGIHREDVMRIHNLYTDPNGESHFRDIEVEWIEERRGSKLSKRLPATGVIFRETRAEHKLDWHPAPRRQYIVNLDAGVKITASDGESRLIGAGEVILVEDTTGKGHLSDHVEGKIRHSIFIPVD